MHKLYLISHGFLESYNTIEDKTILRRILETLCNFHGWLQFPLK